MYVRIRNLNVLVDLQLRQFDQTIVPILLYACGIWGLEDVQLIENIHTDILRKTLTMYAIILIVRRIWKICTYDKCTCQNGLLLAQNDNR